MDEIGSWCEVIRSLLPQRFDVHLLWEREAILVALPSTSRVVFLTAADLRGRTATEVVRSVRDQLLVASRVAC
jgi:hypothetical protein